MSVAMVTALFPPSIGGIQSHTLRLSQKLVERGVAVEVVARLEPGLPRFERLGALPVHRVGAVSGPPPLRSVAFVAAAARRIVALRGRIDVVHAQQLLSPTSAGLLGAPVAGVPLVVNPHACGAIGDVGVLSATAVGRLRLSAIVRRADACVAVSRAIRDELLAAGVASRAIWSIPNGVDTERFRPSGAAERAALRAALGLPAGRPLVVYVGRLAPEKGVDLLVDAWPAVAARARARLAVVGDGPEALRLRDRAEALGVADSIAFTGGVADTAPYLRAADAAALPSRTEGLPVALLEAMACGLPIVATAVGGTPEVLADGATGRLVSPERPEALADGLAEALLDAGAARRWGGAARAQVLAQYALDAVADRFVALYRAVTAGPSACSALRSGRRELGSRLAEEGRP
jgi:glycosyltransferase involved in cell wall biosynthesis